jgi:uncharacterized protein
VNVAVFEDARVFLEQAGDLLAADEPRHNLILGITGTLVASPARCPEKRFWLVTDGGGVVAAAMRTPPYNLIVARPRRDDALVALVEAIDEDLPGVVGARPEADAFAGLWCARRRLEPKILREMGVHALKRIRPVPRVPGGSRPATRDDRLLLLRWLDEFGREVLEEGDPGRTEAEAAVDQRLGVEDGGFLLWEDDGKPVSVSGWGGPTPNGIRIGPVYTPPELRRPGYATALVADLSARLLRSGRRFCFLFTDLANPTSNAIYERVGYVRVCEAAMISFQPV